MTGCGAKVGLFIPPQPFPATVKVSNTVAPSSTCSNGINQNGPAPDTGPRFARIEIIESIAVVHLEVQHWSGKWSGKLAGAQTRVSDAFTLLKCDGEWKITHKLFHWHDR